MRAVVIDEAGGPAAVRTVDDPSPGRAEVVVAVRGCGICGTDRHILEEGLPTARYPLIPGHEPWGEVVAVGGDVSDVHVGGLVAVDPSLHCGTCFRCRRGQGNLCERWGSLGATSAGAWADFVALPAGNAHVLPDGFPADCASIIEPVACALRGLARLGAFAERPVLIFGGGTMGLILAILLELRGAGQITIVEPDAERRLIGERVTGARVVAPQDLHPEVQMEVVIDATGRADVIAAALDHVDAGGTFMVFGVATPEARVPLSPFDVYQREITIVGSMAILGTFAAAVETVGRHAARFRPLLTHAFGLDEIDRAVQTLSDGRAVKVTIAPVLAP